MSLAAGTRLGPYEIVAPLGAGGMGEVYRARDTRLGREVAIKILLPAVARDPERLGRFEREARLLASLSHPNIATLHAFEQLDHQPTLVMELVPGPTLAEMLPDGGSGLPIDDVLKISTQIALALEAAHEAGVVHRDLKPGNIKVSEHGMVKVLDFGLAKALGAPGTDSGADPINSPTLTAQATQAGIILGTAAYMSPEQARGRAADKRADIWAFGVVMYEMSTGTRLFDGETASDTLAAVLRKDVDLTGLPAAMPRAIRQLLRRCLQRDPRQRLHDIADARIVLEEVARGEHADVPAAAAPAPPPGRRGVPWILVAAAAVAGIAIGGVAVRQWPRAASPSSSAVKFVVQPPAGVLGIEEPVMPSDGSFVVYPATTVADTSLYLQRFDEIAPRRLAKTEGGVSPFISPDGRWIGFWRRKSLMKVPVDGGDASVIADLKSYGPGATWGPDGTIVYSQSWLGGLSALSEGGGASRALTTLDASRGDKGHWWPRFLPDGRAVLFTIWPSGTGLNDAKVAAVDLATGKTDVLLAGARATYIDPGILVFYRAGAYYAVRFDQDSRKVSGTPVRVLDDARPLSPQGDTDLSLVASPNGAMAYRPGLLFTEAQLSWLGTDGKLTPLSLPTKPANTAAISPDGGRLAEVMLDSGRYVIHVVDIARGTDEALDMPGSNSRPVWHPDGKRLTFLSMQRGDFDIFSKDLTSNAPPAPLLVTERDEMPYGWTPDGRHLLFQQSDPDGVYRLKIMDPATPAQARTLASEPSSGQASADGRWVLFSSSVSGRSEVYVRRLEGESAPVRVSAAGGTGAEWSRRGSEIFFMKGQAVAVVSYRTDGDRFTVLGERVAYVPVAGQRVFGFLAAADGRVIVSTSAETPIPPQLRVISNWIPELERRLAAGR